MALVSPFGATANLYELQPSTATLPIVRIAAGEGAAALEEIESVWNDLAPSVALKMEFADQTLNRAYAYFGMVTSVFLRVAMLALAISVLGLIGMSIQVIGRRQHEIGVRKTLGASVTSVVRLLLTDFSKPVVIANLIAWPMAYFVMNLYLSVFTLRTGLSLTPFLLSLASTMAIAWIAVSAQATRAARMKPARCFAMSSAATHSGPRATGYGLRPEHAVRAANGSTGQRVNGPEQPAASAPESAGGRDPILLGLLPIACVLWFIVFALGLVAIATASERATAIDWDQERAAFVRDLDAVVLRHALRERAGQGLRDAARRAAALEKQYPDRAEPLVLHAWALRAQADISGRSLAALTLGRQAVEKLEAAVERDPTVYGAATYACLGALYADVDVPGFRSYSRKKARLYLDKALALDPQGPQQNLSLAWLSFKEKDHAAALRLATAASNAPARPGREKADADLRERATSLIAAVNDKAR